jgi:phage RecT family recombinase
MNPNTQTAPRAAVADSIPSAASIQASIGTQILHPLALAGEYISGRSIDANELSILPDIKGLDAADRAAMIRQGLAQILPRLPNILPPHISPRAFATAVVTAVSKNPELLKCTPESFFLSVAQAANDGLMPDGKLGALVPRKNKQSLEATWMPMIAGIVKKMYGSGSISTIEVGAVYQGDEWDHWTDETGVHFRHRRKSDGRGLPVAAYSLVRNTLGHISICVLEQSDIISIKAKASEYSQAWKDFPGEMCGKSCLRRHSKSLNLSPDIDRVIQRVDAEYDFDSKPAVEHSMQGRDPGAQRLTAETPSKASATQRPAASQGNAPVIDPDAVATPAVQRLMGSYMDPKSQPAPPADIFEGEETVAMELTRIAKNEGLAALEARGARLSVGDKNSLCANKEAVFSAVAALKALARTSDEQRAQRAAAAKAPLLPEEMTDELPLASEASRFDF